MPDMDQLISRMLGDYRIERLLGQSQLGAAYLATEPARGTRVMVTTFNFPPGQDRHEREQFCARFAREGAELTRLVHATLLPIYAIGEEQDCLYLITAYVKQASLGQTLRQNTRFTLRQTLHVLRQMAAGLDYAHSQGIFHGMLSLANIVIDSDQGIGIAGFGLRTMLEMYSSVQHSRPLAHLSSAQGAFLGSPEYIAPERVLGLACDARVDIYALGVMIFELLSGVQPFRAATPLDIALQRLQQPAPLVHVAYPAVSEAFDLVIGRALERDPTRRFQSAGEMADAFERVLKAQEASPPAHAATGQRMPDMQMTIPPTVNWFDEQITPSGRWKVAPPIGATRMRTLEKSPYGTDKMEVAEGDNLAPSPYSTDKLGWPDGGSLAPSPSYSTDKPGLSHPLPLTEGRASMPKAPGASLAGIDPFAWWSSHAGGRRPMAAIPPVQARRAPLRLSLPGFQARPRPDQQGRRKVVTLAVAGVAAAGALSIGALAFSHLAQGLKQPSSLASVSRTAVPTPTAMSTQASTPAAKPTKASTKVPPGHTGTAIGATTQPVNTARIFNNPADGVSSLLIRLSNGNFEACERTCTHKGVLVDYDPQRKLIVCPAHDAVFDPKNGFGHISGPGAGPLPRITIRVNGDGTITTG